MGYICGCLPGVPEDLKFLEFLEFDIFEILWPRIPRISLCDIEFLEFHILEQQRHELMSAFETWNQAPIEDMGL